MKPYYEHAGITIYHGDCRDVLPSLELADSVLVIDPPYGINHASCHVAPTTTARWMKSTIAGDSNTDLRDHALALFDEWACFGTIKRSVPVGTSGVLVWDKGPQSGMGDLTFPWKTSWELIFISGNRWSGRRDEGVIKGLEVVTRASMGRVHPNEKPVSLILHLINKHPATLIVDPCMGSGPTLVAAQQAGRKSIGIEIEERYCEIAARRLAQEVFEFAG